MLDNATSKCVGLSVSWHKGETLVCASDIGKVGLLEGNRLGAPLIKACDPTLELVVGEMLLEKELEGKLNTLTIELLGLTLDDTRE